MTLVMLAPTLIKVGVWIDFKVNQDFIAQVLCINKEKPMLSCNGQCILAQKLQKAEEKKEPNRPISQSQKVEDTYPLSDSRFEFLPPSVLDYIDKLHPSWVHSSYQFSLIADIFHPPASRCI